MDKTRIVRGDDLMVFDSQMHSIAYATSHTLTLTSDVAEISCKDSGAWKDAVVNKLGWEVSTENLYSEKGYDDLYDKWSKRSLVTICFGAKKQDDKTEITTSAEYWEADTTKMYTGLAYITNISVNAASGDNATFSVTFQGVGAYTKKGTPEPVPELPPTSAPSENH